MMRSFPVRLFMVLAILAAPARLTAADLELPALFSDSMVIQRDQPARVWGWAAAGEEVVVEFAKQRHAVRANDQGRWSARLAPSPVGGPHTLTVTDHQTTLVVNDVLVGEVWLCSGQSNMAMTVSRAQDFEAESAAAKHPRIRMFRVASADAQEPQDRCRGAWTVCSPTTVGGFSATAYFFGLRLHQELNVPIGLINSSVGGTSIESWTSMEAQRAVEAIQPRLQAWQEEDQRFDAAVAKAKYERMLKTWKEKAAAAKADGKKAPRRPREPARPRQDRNYPANLYNGKINPLVGYTLRGAIWYQGENSSGRGFANLYGDQLRTLIADWRSRWAQGDFPFAWVQLPNYRAPQEKPSETSGWVLVQEGMLAALDTPHTGMAVTLDVGEQNDIHPKDKQTVGSRLAQWALADVYGKEILPMGPIYQRAEVQAAEIRLHFAYAGGLHARSKKAVGVPVPGADRVFQRAQQVEGFAIAGEDRVFHWATARIEGETVLVSSEDVPHPVAVRYAWSQNPVFSLYNEAGIPASPFRTDDWQENP